MAAAILTGQTFGRLTVLGPAPHELRFSTSRAWICQCHCGRRTHVITASLTSGNTLSCGCLHREILAARLTTHGLIATRAYASWRSAKARCFNIRAPQYPYYGGRGITMCEKWRDDFAAFFVDMGERPEGTTLERLDNNRNYEPANCVWLNQRQQSGNRRSNVVLEWNGQQRTIADWERQLGFKAGTLKARLHLGWPLKRAITTPVRRHHYRSA